MYAQMAKDAKERGFDHLAFLFEEVGKIERERKPLPQAAGEC